MPSSFSAEAQASAKIANTTTLELRMDEIGRGMMDRASKTDARPQCTRLSAQATKTCTLWYSSGHARRLDSPIFACWAHVWARVWAHVWAHVWARVRVAVAHRLLADWRRTRRDRLCSRFGDGRGSG